MKIVLHLFVLLLVVVAAACAPASEPEAAPPSEQEPTVTSVVESSDAWMGTWKVNFEPSTFDPPRSPRPGEDSRTTTLEPWEDGHKATTVGLDAQGQPIQVEAISKFDGEEHQVVGAAVPTTRTYRRIDDRTYEFVTKVDGKVTTTSRSEVAVDSMTRTLTVTGTTAEGEPTNNVVVYERQ